MARHTNANKRTAACAKRRAICHGVYTKLQHVQLNLRQDKHLDGRSYIQSLCVHINSESRLVVLDRFT